MGVPLRGVSTHPGAAGKAVTATAITAIHTNKIRKTELMFTGLIVNFCKITQFRQAYKIISQHICHQQFYSCRAQWLSDIKDV